MLDTFKVSHQGKKTRFMCKKDILEKKISCYSVIIYYTYEDKCLVFLSLDEGCVFGEIRFDCKCLVNLNSYLPK